MTTGPMGGALATQPMRWMYSFRILSVLLALEIPSLNTSYNIWVNGALVASAGTVGIEKEKTTPQWVHKTVSLTNTSDTLKIVLQLSNFHHHKGGEDEIQFTWVPKIR